jgi:hypothetical protein
MNTADVKAALRDRYLKPEWAIFFEVANGTGGNARRYADAIAMNLFPSRGLEINGFEIKVSRSDWLRELKNPEKAESIFKFCDRWWIVASRDSLKVDELPPTWGYIEAKDGKLRQVVQAPKLNPVAIDRAFAAALIRRAGEADGTQIACLVEREVAAIRKMEKERADHDIEMRTRRATELIAKVEEIKKLTGIDLKGWTPAEDVARAIRFGMSIDINSKYGVIDESIRSAEKFIERLNKAKASMELQEPKEQAA